VNEALNNLIAHITPKNRTYSMSELLKARLHVALGIQILGFWKYFNKVFFRLLELPTEEPFTNFLELKEKFREDKHAHQKMLEVKVKRWRLYHRNLKNKTREMERAKQDGDYGRGIGLTPIEDETPAGSGGEAGGGCEPSAGKKPKVACVACRQNMDIKRGAQRPAASIMTISHSE
jgi:hypothetical protein